MTGYVYAIRCGSRVKLGWSVYPWQRLADLRIGNPEPCELVGTVEATRKQEAELQQILRPWRVQGEWFQEVGPVAAFVGMVRPHPEPLRVATYEHGGARLRQWRTGNRVTLEDLGQTIGATKSFLSKIERGVALPSASTMSRLVAATNGAVTASDFMPSDQETAA